MAAIHTSDYNGSKTVGECEYFNYLGSMIANDARCTGKLNPGLTWQKRHLARGRNFSPANIDLNLRKKLVKCYIWGIALVWCCKLDTLESRSEIP
jgi:hypothetical protein